MAAKFILLALICILVAQTQAAAVKKVTSKDGVTALYVKDGSTGQLRFLGAGVNNNQGLNAWITQKQDFLEGLRPVAPGTDTATVTTGTGTVTNTPTNTVTTTGTGTDTGTVTTTNTETGTGTGGGNRIVVGPKRRGNNRRRVNNRRRGNRRRPVRRGGKKGNKKRPQVIVIRPRA